MRNDEKNEKKRRSVIRYLELNDILEGFVLFSKKYKRRTYRPDLDDLDDDIECLIHNIKEKTRITTKRNKK
jgi:hypothetical protein